MIKNRLIEFRTKLGYRFAKEFSKAAGVSYVSYTQWENNETQISLANLIKLRDFIQTKMPDQKIHIDDLLYLGDEK
jgi:transcriptional regulator with XRE-family HTH domain